jgi:hypothetical protein
MKTTISLISALAVLAASSAMAQITYLGTGDALGSSPADGAGFNSVVVNNDASTISFTINSTQAQASYIFYAIELQIIGQAGSGYTGFANPFGPAVGISSGENALIDTFGTGATPYIYSGGWVAGSAVSYAAGGTGTTSSTITVPLNSLGLSAGSQFYFDVVSTYTSVQNGGPQAAYGALDNKGYPAESDGAFTPYNGTSHYDSATDASGTIFGTPATLYTVGPVPEPTTFSLLGLGALVMIRAMANRKK